MSRLQPPRLLLLLGLSSATACFNTDSINGLPCESDEDCGPLACVEGVCGGNGEAGSEGAEDASTSSDASSGDGDTTSGDGDTTTTTGDGDSGDGDSGDGDGDGDSSTGDGDDTSGDGDGDTGDGDATSGDGDTTTTTTTTGDGDSGDGDSGDGDSTTSGDGDSGDGDSTTGGDGDGDGDGDPVCGNGVIEGDEICDDGTDLNDDACTSECVVRASALSTSFNIPAAGAPHMASTDEGETYIVWNDVGGVDSAKIDVIGALNEDPLNGSSLDVVADIETHGTDVVLMGETGAAFGYELWREATGTFDLRTPLGPTVASQFTTSSYLDRGWIAGQDNTSSFDADDLLIEANFGSNGRVRWDDHNERLVGIVGSGVSVWNGMLWQDITGPLMKDITALDVGPGGELYFACKESGAPTTPCSSGAIQKVLPGGQVVPVVDDSAFAFDAIAVDGHNSRIVAMSQGTLITIPINMPRFEGRKRWPADANTWGHYTFNDGSGSTAASHIEGEDGIVTGTVDWGDTYFAFDGPDHHRPARVQRRRRRAVHLGCAHPAQRHRRRHLQLRPQLHLGPQHRAPPLPHAHGHRQRTGRRQHPTLGQPLARHPGDL